MLVLTEQTVLLYNITIYRALCNMHVIVQHACNIYFNSLSQSIVAFIECSVE